MSAAATPTLLAELHHADHIIKVMLNAMTIQQKATREEIQYVSLRFILFRKTAPDLYGDRLSGQLSID